MDYQVILENIIYNPDGSYKTPDVYDDLPYSIAKVSDLHFIVKGKLQVDSKRWLKEAHTLYHLLSYRGC